MKWGVTMGVALWAGMASAQGLGPIEGFNRSMTEVARSADDARLESMATALRENMAMGEISIAIIGQYQASFSDDQLRRLSRAILYKLAGDIMNVTGGEVVYLQRQGMSLSEGGREVVPVIVQIQGERPVSAEILVSRDMQGNERMHDLVLNGFSAVQAEAKAFAEIAEVTKGDPERVVQTYEEMARSASDFALQPR